MTHTWLQKSFGWVNASWAGICTKNQCSAKQRWALASVLTIINFRSGLFELWLLCATRASSDTFFKYPGYSNRSRLLAGDCRGSSVSSGSQWPILQLSETGLVLCPSISKSDHGVFQMWMNVLPVWLRHSNKNPGRLQDWNVADTGKWVLSVFPVSHYLHPNYKAGHSNDLSIAYQKLEPTSD